MTTQTVQKQAFVRELLGRSDYAISGEIVEPRTKVLDLGCGEGELLEWLAQNKGVDARGWRSRARRSSAPSPAVSRSSRAISMQAWPTIPIRRSIT
ncbi:MAG: methionine biosynthesis protein MetW [Ignavibacteriota bacterium]